MAFYFGIQTTATESVLLVEGFFFLLHQSRNEQKLVASLYLSDGGLFFFSLPALLGPLSNPHSLNLQRHPRTHKLAKWHARDLQVKFMRYSMICSLYFMVHNKRALPFLKLDVLSVCLCLLCRCGWWFFGLAFGPLEHE